MDQKIAYHSIHSLPAGEGLRVRRLACGVTLRSCEVTRLGM
jgi:hypothetical protein